MQETLRENYAEAVFATLAPPESPHRTRGGPPGENFASVGVLRDRIRR